ncbi:MAG: Cfr10I/Bse634I family restriction endonuclease [Cycloclasticus sp.]|nr:Cfr10I/Bse634I family restriction endonuclease [Cycloclasticus sp.]
MSILYIKSNGNVGINKAKAFCKYSKYIFSQKGMLITSFLKQMDENILSLQKNSSTFCALPTVTTGALANSHGDWYEWLLAITALNHHLSNNTKHIALLLPNVTRFDVSSLYKPDIQNIILDLKEKVKESAEVQFVTSNPDFVIIDIQKTDVDIGFLQSIENTDENLVPKLESIYKHFINKCSFDDIVGYLSVKTSLRPDRRLQIAHEGSLMKAIYAHLQTRQWILTPKGLRYYAAATVIKDPDRNALRTVATHSIITVNTLPQAAVDEVFQVNCLNKANEMFSIILND